jgi:CRP-like cAMP-binding protein
MVQIGTLGVTDNANEVKATKSQVQDVFALFNSIHHLPVDVLHYLQQHMHSLHLKRGDILHTAGYVCQIIYFIRKGAVRGYVLEDNKDITTWISVENELAASIASFVLQIPSVDNLEILEDAELVGISFVDLQKLYQLVPEFNIPARKMYEKYYADAEIRALIGRLSRAERKYEFFLHTYRHLANRIQLTYIASFLGINLATLSRVRSKTRFKSKN